MYELVIKDLNVLIKLILCNSFQLAPYYSLTKKYFCNLYYIHMVRKVGEHIYNVY